jgi:HEAT repeat protein
MRQVVLVGLCLLLGVAACKDDPSTPQHWEKRIGDAKGKKEKLKAIEDLRGSKHLTPVMLPMLEKRLTAEKNVEVKASLARLLGEQKNASSVDALLDAVDPSGDSDSRGLNKEIAAALGAMGDPKAVPTLIRLLKTKDNYTTIAAIESLGRLKAKEAFAPLYEIANDEKIEPFITRKAIEALGELGDPRAVPGLLKAMYRAKGFYREASFALYELGQPAAEALVAVVEKRDKALFDWGTQNGIQDFAILVKAIQVLGDLHEMRAEKAIVALVPYKNEYDDLRIMMRTHAADALGRMRSKAGGKAIATVFDDPNPDARREYVWALARIGSKEPLAKLVETSAKGPWEARVESMRGVAMLADDPAVFDKFLAAEPKLFKAQCAEDDAAEGCHDRAGSVKSHLTRIKALAARATAARACRDASDWAKRLDDPDEGVRERAAYEVGRSGQGALVGELMKRLTEKNLDTRLAFIQGADWLVHDAPQALAEAKKGAATLAKQIAEERGKTEFDRVNEDLRRLLAKISR